MNKDKSYELNKEEIKHYFDKYGFKITEPKKLNEYVKKYCKDLPKINKDFNFFEYRDKKN